MLGAQRDQRHLRVPFLPAGTERDVGGLSSGSVKQTVTATTSSPSDSAAEMPAAVSRDIDATGTTTSEGILAGGSGVWPSASDAPILA